MFEMTRTRAATICPSIKTIICNYFSNYLISVSVLFSKVQCVRSREIYLHKSNIVFIFMFLLVCGHLKIRIIAVSLG